MCKQQTRESLSHREKDETFWFGAVLTAIPDEVTVTVQLRIDVLEPLRQETLCHKNTNPL